MINDLEWQGRYRMFSVPSPPSLKGARFLRVIAERTRGARLQPADVAGAAADCGRQAGVPIADR